LLGVLIVDYTSVINYASNGSSWVLIDLPGTCWCQVVSWWPLVRTLGSLIAILFLSAVSCKVTRFSAKEACEDFPLSVLLDGSSGITSFSVTSYTLFMSGSSWEEILCFGYSSPSSARCCIHGIWVAWRCVVIPWSYPSWRWAWSCSESFRSILHMCKELLLFDSCVSPISIVLWFGSPHDVGVHLIG
jgi:hypothetical protein